MPKVSERGGGGADNDHDSYQIARCLLPAENEETPSREDEVEGGD